MKKRYAILLACTTAIFFAACSGGNPASQVESAPSSSQTVSSQAVEPPSSTALVQIESSSTAVSETPSSSESASSQRADEQAPNPSSEPSEAPESSATETELIEEETGKALVIYYSWSGNTKSVAQEIQSQTGADSFELVPVTPYTDDYDALLDLAQEEQRNNTRPAISGSVDLSGYDTIYLGYPNWWGDMPMIIYSLLDDYDLSGKTVAPFCTSGGSGLSGSVDAIRSAEPDATVLNGLHIGSDSASNSASTVSQWLAGHGQ